MAYLLLIVEPRGQRAERKTEEALGLYEEMKVFGQQLHAEGVLLGSESLRTDDHAVRVSSMTGKTQLRDGPFAESKEMVGGFFMIDVATRDAALAIASRCPAARWASVEVRECAPCHVN